MALLILAEFNILLLNVEENFSVVRQILTRCSRV